MGRDYLLIIDVTPVDDGLIRYFAQFNIDLIQTTNLKSLPQTQTLPYALLIACSILKKTPELISELYKKYLVPLLIMSSGCDEAFCIRMLETGADDCLIKPFFPREIHARINAIRRRVFRVDKEGKEILIFTNWRVYPASRQVFNHNNNKELLLSAGEYDLLLIFIQHPQKILTRELLLKLTKKSEFNPYDRRIDIQISRLRHKIEYDAKKPMLIKTIRNNGYLFTAPVITYKEGFDCFV